MIDRIFFYLYLRCEGSPDGNSADTLVQKLDFLYAAPHSHAQETNIANIEDVAKFGCCTWKQTLNQTLIVECNVVLKPSCGTVEISTSRKEQTTKKKKEI